MEGIPIEQAVVEMVAGFGKTADDIWEFIPQLPERIIVLFTDETYCVITLTMPKGKGVER